MKHLITIILLLAAMPIWAQNAVDLDSASTEQSLQSRINDADNTADSLAATDQQAVPAMQQPTNYPDDSGPNLLVMGVLTLCGITGIVMSVVAFSKIKAMKQEKDNEITALKTALKQRNEEFEQSLRQIETRIAMVEQDREAVARTSVAPRQVTVGQATAMSKTEKKAGASKIFLSRPDDRGVFMATSSHIEPGNSIFVLTTADGTTGTFAVINDAGVHQLALMMPTENLTRACTGHNIQISAGKTRIVTDAPGRAVKEGRQWKIVQQATIHYE